jgi:DNA phosphorothioation-dependent restriction protein DptG
MTDHAIISNIKDAHQRKFPELAFYPSPIRPLNREVLDLIILNVLLEKNPPITKLKNIKTEVISFIKGDDETVNKTWDLFQNVAFTSPESDKKGDRNILRISHPRYGQIYKPEHTYEINAWVSFFFNEKFIKPVHLKRLKEIVQIALSRKMNLIEHAIEKAIETAIENKQNGKSDDIEEGNEKAEKKRIGRPAFDFFHIEFGKLCETLINKGNSFGPGNALEAEDLIKKILRLYEIYLWFYWVHMHLDAYYAIQTLRSGEWPRAFEHPKSLDFGYEKEQASIESRPFRKTRKDLENKLYCGSIAINALAALHDAAELKEPVWFNEIESKIKNKENTAEKMNLWTDAYFELIRKDKKDIDNKKDLKKAIVRTYDAILSFSSEGPRNGAYPYTVGYGVARQFGQGVKCKLLINIGKGRSRGIVAMFDAELLLLLGSGLSNIKDKRIRLNVILDYLRDTLGMVFDDYTIDTLIEDFENRDLVSSLSDSGEARYVNIE